MTEDPKAWLRESFQRVQERLALDLKQAKRSIKHPGTQGAVNEENWQQVLRAYLPKRYEVGTAIVVDSLGAQSEQIDVAIFDNQYTPTLLDQQSHRYVPAEAVYAVFEAKPHIDKGYLKYASEKAASVRRMHRTSAMVTHAGGTFVPREPFRIIGGILAPRCTWVDGFGASFRGNLPQLGDGAIDCGCALAHGSFDNFDGELSVVEGGTALLSFLFRLLKQLQGLGTVPAVDWSAYEQILRSPDTGPRIRIM